MYKSYHCLITGKVQGSSLQGWALDHAQRLGLAGWVRFISDGKAEIMLQGTAEAYREFRELLDAQAPVPDRRVECEVVDYDKKHETFELRG